LILVVRQTEQLNFQLDDPELPSFACATSLAFARVLRLATIVTRLTAALAFTFVLAFAPVLALFGICHCLQRDTGMRSRCARGKSANREGTCQQAGDSRTCNQCFGWSNHVSTLSVCFVVGVWLPPPHCFSRKTIKHPVF
jgi:hypothetical protein